MSKTEWGDPIRVDGERPEWLGDDETVLARCRDDYEDTGIVGHLNGLDGTDNWFSTDAGDDMIVSIRLPADHPYYIATSQGFTYWPGGDNAPDDWDGSDVLVIDTTSVTRSTDMIDGNNQFLDSCWRHEKGYMQVIGYKRTKAPEEFEPGSIAIHNNASGFELARIGYLPIVSPELVNRMMQLMHKMILVPGDYTEEARAIAAELPDASPASQLDELSESHEMLVDRVNQIERTLTSRIHALESSVYHGKRELR